MEGDIEKATELLKEIREKCNDATSAVGELKKRAENGEFDTSKGISFLEVKYQLLLSYLINLTLIMLKKSCGKSIKGDSAVERLVEIRTVLEKMRPIDQKLKYQIDKVIRLAATGQSNSNDPLRFKANPESLEVIDGSDDESGSGTESVGSDNEKANKLYRPPKLVSAHYDGDETLETKRQKQMETLRKRALNSDILQDLKEQYYDGPEEIKETRDLHRLREEKKSKERQRYEEEHFTRLTVAKKDKHSERQMATVSSLHTLTQFGSISVLDMDDDDMEGLPAKRRKTTKSKGKGKKKGFKKKGKF